MFRFGPLRIMMRMSSLFERGDCGTGGIVSRRHGSCRRLDDGREDMKYIKKMKLYFAPGTISLMPHVALLESGLPFATVRVDETSKRMEDGGDYRAVNPLGYLPALALDDGTVLREAAAIAQYIADRQPTAGLAPPPGTIARAQLQAWLNFLSSEMHKGGLGPLFYRTLDERAKDVFRERLKARFAFLDRHLAECTYLVNDYSIADVGLYAMTGWAPRVGFDLRAYPNVMAHQSRIGAREAVREVQRIEGAVPAA
jgi:glutathione S-transferase